MIILDLRGSSFSKRKDKALKEFSKICKQLQVYKKLSIVSIRSGHRREFDQKEFIEFCNTHAIAHNFLAPCTPQQDGIVERKNCTLEDMARTMMCKSNVSQNF